MLQIFYSYLCSYWIGILFLDVLLWVTFQFAFQCDWIIILYISTCNCWKILLQDLLELSSMTMHAIFLYMHWIGILYTLRKHVSLLTVFIGQIIGVCIFLCPLPFFEYIDFVTQWHRQKLIVGNCIAVWFKF